MVEAQRSVRVVVRVRPPDAKSQSPCEALVIEGDGRRITVVPPQRPQTGTAEEGPGGLSTSIRRPNTAAAAAAGGGGNSKSYSFDAALGPGVSQGNVYDAAGVQGLVEAAAQGFHATILAYGQTGSGKTYTMEGYKYVARAHGPPVADFDGTPEQQLGVVPRAVHALFEALKKETGRRHVVKCSYVQIYKEQAYDLLNPATIAAAMLGPRPSPQQLKGSPGLPGAAAGALRMRWSKQDDFYLENLFKVECSSPHEVLSLFRGGVLNKVMASHKLNASSSRSHCLFTLYIDSCPLSSPTEIISSRLTLVDLAGSERAATVGATEGKLRDENVAINKSLFTLRQVITSLASSSSSSAPSPAANHANSSGDTTTSAEGGGGNGLSRSPSSSFTRTPSRSQSWSAAAAATMGRPLPTPPSQASSSASHAQQQHHVPYRDSKLTSLLKNSLGGNSLTLMVACLAPSDNFYDENISTLDYASRASRITNQVALNEDPKTKLIRELREEVAFIRQQLAAINVPAASSYNPAAAVPKKSPPVQGSARDSPPSPSSGDPEDTLVNAEQRVGDLGEGAAATASTPPLVSSQDSNHKRQKEEDEQLRGQLLASSQSDVGVVVTKLLDAIGLVQTLSAANQQLRTAYHRNGQRSEQVRIENDNLMIENANLRDRLAFIEGMAGIPETVPSSSSAASRNGSATGANVDASSSSAAGDYGYGSIMGAPPPPSGGVGGGPAVYTPSAAALIELQELRRENALLRERLRLDEDPGRPGWDMTLRPSPSGGGGGGGNGGSPLGIGGPGGRAGGKGFRNGAGGSARLMGGSNTARASTASPRRLGGGPGGGGAAATAAAATAASIASNPFTPAVLRSTGSVKASSPSSVGMSVQNFQAIIRGGGGGGGEVPSPTSSHLPGLPLHSPPPPQEPSFLQSESNPGSPMAPTFPGASSSSSSSILQAISAAQQQAWPGSPSSSSPSSALTSVEGHTAKLAQLMTQRNAMARARILGGGVTEP